MHSKPSCVVINYGNLIFLTCFSQHLSYTFYVEDIAECGREYRRKCGSPRLGDIWEVHPQGQSTSSGVTQEEW